MTTRYLTTKHAERLSALRAFDGACVQPMSGQIDRPNLQVPVREQSVT